MFFMWMVYGSELEFIHNKPSGSFIIRFLKVALQFRKVGDAIYVPRWYCFDKLLNSSLLWFFFWKDIGIHSMAFLKPAWKQIIESMHSKIRHYEQTLNQNMCIKKKQELNYWAGGESELMHIIYEAVERNVPYRRFAFEIFNDKYCIAEWSATGGLWPGRRPSRVIQWIKWSAETIL